MSAYFGMSRKQINDTINEFLGEQRVNQPFEFPFLADLMVFWAFQKTGRGVRPSRFMRYRPAGAPHEVFMVETDGVWFKRSWRKCVYPNTGYSKFRSALRAEVHQEMQAYRAAHPICELCGVAASAEVDHVRPEFAEIVRSLWDGLSAEEQIDEIKHLRGKGQVRLKESSSVLALFRDIHRHAVIKAVCHECHLKAGAARHREEDK